MLNNTIVNIIEKECISEEFKFFKSLSNTRRSVATYKNDYLFLFKKSPVSNLKTVQDDLIKNQELDRHVIFVVYKVNDFWSSITNIELQYYASTSFLSYSFDITDITDKIESEKRIKLSGENRKPEIKIRKENIINKKAE